MPSHLHLLPVGSMLPPPPDGHVTRQRLAVRGAGLALLDVEVEAAGGWVAPLGDAPRARGDDSSSRPTWYVLPGAALPSTR